MQFGAQISFIFKRHRVEINRRVLCGGGGQLVEFKAVAVVGGDRETSKLHRSKFNLPINLPQPPTSQITQTKLRFSYFKSHSLDFRLFFAPRTAPTKINATRFRNGKIAVDVSIWHLKFSYCFRLHEFHIMNCCE
jgi:hypothetical protein